MRWKRICFQFPQSEFDYRVRVLGLLRKQKALHAVGLEIGELVEISTRFFGVLERELL